MATVGGLLLAGVALFLLTRAVVLRRRVGPLDVSLTPVEVAYLVGGPEHAVLVAALALHVHNRPLGRLRRAQRRRVPLTARTRYKSRLTPAG